MPAFVRAAIAGFFIFEISAAFLMGLVTMLLFALHITGVVFWSAETLTGIGALYLSGLFFMSALKYERSAVRVTASED